MSFLRSKLVWNVSVIELRWVKFTMLCNLFSANSLPRISRQVLNLSNNFCPQLKFLHAHTSKTSGGGFGVTL